MIKFNKRRHGQYDLRLEDEYVQRVAEIKEAYRTKVRGEKRALNYMHGFRRC